MSESQERLQALRREEHEVGQKYEAAKREVEDLYHREAELDDGQQERLGRQMKAMTKLSDRRKELGRSA